MRLINKAFICMHKYKLSRFICSFYTAVMDLDDLTISNVTRHILILTHISKCIFMRNLEHPKAQLSIA